MDEVCAPGYRGRKRGQVVRTRTVISQAHSSHWLGSFGNRGNGRYREELRKALAAIGRYLTAYQLPQERTLLHIFDQYGTGSVLTDLASFAFVTRGKEYAVLDHPLVQARLHLPPDQLQQREDKPDGAQPRPLPTGASGIGGRPLPRGGRNPSGWQQEESRWSHACGRRLRTVLHQFARAGRSPPLMWSNCICIVGHYAPQLSDEDREQDPDRWCSHTAWGQECWQVVSQWVWNLRLELGHQLLTSPVRTTEFAPGLSEINEPSTCGYGKPTVAAAFKVGRFSGQDFAFQPDGTLRCQASQKLSAHEQRREADGSLRVVYGASMRSCRPCPLRRQCQWNGGATAKPRQVSVLLHPVVVGSAPLLWHDWSRRQHRRACRELVRDQHIEVRQE